MAAPSPQSVTQLLKAWNRGDPRALDRLMPQVHTQLRRLARRRLAQERRNHTLESAALVNEAYLRMIDCNEVDWQDRLHFFGLAARMMRRILVDHARRQRAGKRGGSVAPLPLDEAIDGDPGGRPDIDLIALDQALHKLAELDERQSRIVELRFFGGLTVSEIAEVLGISRATVKRDWVTAKAWLYHELDTG